MSLKYCPMPWIFSLCFLVLDISCPGSVPNRIYYGSYCMGLVDDKQSKDMAERTCADYGGRLVEIDTAGMQIFISTEITKRMNNNGWIPAYWWIGASVDTSERYWKWTDGKSHNN